MNHPDAVALGAVEKYVLGELSVAERDDFEAHYFECAECASQLQALEALRGTLREPPPQVMPARGRSWMERPAMARAALAASVLLGVVVGYQNIYTLPELRQAVHQPRLITTIQPDTQYRGAPVAAMDFRVPLQFRPGFTAYRIELQSASGSPLAGLHVTAQEAASSEGIRFARTTERSGNLQIVIYGENASFQPQEINRHRIYVP